MGIRFVLIIAFPLLLGACAVYSHSGLYLVSDAVGWEKEQAWPATLFRPHTMHPADGYLVITSHRKGEIVVYGSFIGHTFQFQNDTVRVFPHNGGAPLTFSILDPRMDVSSTLDFRIELPPILIDNQPMPPITVRCRWSDQIYRDYVGIGE
jgi:hypothetical protein